MADAAAIPVPFDGTLLERPLEGPPPPAPEDGVPDARVESLTEAVARSDYAAAARTAEALLREGLRDARLIGPYLFGSFQERGLHAMPGMFRSLHTVLTASYPSFGPEDKRDVFTDTGLRWLLRTLNKHLAHHEKKQDDTWRQWCEPGCRAPLEEALTLSGPILTVLSTTPPKSACVEPFRNLTLWLERHVQSLPPPAPPRAEPAEASVPSPALASAAVVPAPTAVAPPAPVPAPEPGLPISPAMALLLRKLEAFDTLLALGELAKAGVVASDLLATVERFDPRVYLPALFPRFFAGLSTHARKLEPFLHESPSLSARALEQLYRVDLDAFLAQRVDEAGEED